MDNQNFNENKPREEAVFLKEKSSHKNNIWYIILAILFFGVVGWYGYTAGWFNRSLDDTNLSIESNNKIDNGTTDTESLLKKEQAPISNVVINTGNGFPIQKTLRIQGNLPDSCAYLNEPQVIRKGNTFYVNLSMKHEGDTCTEALVPYEQNIGLDVAGLPAGVYTVVINGKQTTFSLEQDNSLDLSSSGGK